MNQDNEHQEHQDAAAAMRAALEVLGDGTTAQREEAERQARRTAERAAAQPLTEAERATELARLVAELATTREQAAHLAALVRGHADALLREQRPDLAHLPV